MKTRETTRNISIYSLYKLYEYVYSNKADTTKTARHLASKKNKKVTHLRCNIILMPTSPLTNPYSVNNPAYILAPEGLYYHDDISKPVSVESLINADDEKIKNLWVHFSGKNVPVARKAQSLSPKDQRTITHHTHHSPKELKKDEVVIANKTKNISSEERQNRVHHDKEEEKNQKINEFAFIVNNMEKKGVFRLILRNIKSNYLEILLFGNNTESLANTPISSKIILPDENEIKKLFHSINQGEDGHHLFSGSTEKEEKQFIVFFWICKIIADFIEENNDIQNSVAAEHAYKMLVLFGYNETGNPFLHVESYLNAYQCYQQLKPIHDTFAAYNLPRLNPEDGEAIKDMNGWRRFIQESGKNAISYFQQAYKIENFLHGAPKNLDEAKTALATFSYKYYDEYPELAEICMQYNISEKIFNKCLEIEKKRKKSDNLPDVIIDGKDAGYAGYYIVKLPIDDPRAYVLGHITHCCQSIGGHSEQCVIDGLTYENNGFYVLLRGKPDQQPMINNRINPRFKIIGQGYAWLNTGKDTLVLDSWENLREEDDNIIVSMMPVFGKAVTDVSEIYRVNIGNGGKTPEALKQKMATPERMVQGTQYGDSREQSLIFYNMEKVEKIKNKLIEKWKSLPHQPFNMNLDTEEFSRFVFLSELNSISMIRFIENVFVNNIENTDNALYDADLIIQLYKNSDSFRKNYFLFTFFFFEHDLIDKNNSAVLKKLLHDCALIKEAELNVYSYSINYNLDIMKVLFSNLQEEGLLTSDNIQLLLIKKFNLSNTTKAIIKLSKAGLWRAEFKKAINSNYEVLYVANNLISCISDKKLTENGLRLLNLYNVSNKLEHQPQDACNIAACLENMEKYNILSNENAECIINERSYGLALTDIFIYLNNAGILSDSTRKAIMETVIYYRTVVAKGLVALNEAGLLTEIHINAIIKDSLHCEEIITALKKLNQAGILNDTTRQLILSHMYHKENISDGLIRLNDAGIMSDNNCKILSADPYCLDSLLNLHEAGILTIVNTRLMLDHPEYISNIITALFNLHHADLLRDDYIEIVNTHPKWSNYITQSISDLKKADLLFPKYVELVCKYENISYKISDTLITLKEANLLDSENFWLYKNLYNKSDFHHAIRLLKKSGLLTKENFRALVSNGFFLYDKIVYLHKNNQLIQTNLSNEIKLLDSYISSLHENDADYSEEELNRRNEHAAILEKSRLIKIFEKEIQRLRKSRKNIFHWGGSEIKITAYNQIIRAIQASDDSVPAKTVLENIKNTQVQVKRGKMKWVEDEYIETDNGETKKIRAGSAITIEDALMWRRSKLSFFSSDSAKVWKKIFSENINSIKNQI